MISCEKKGSKISPEKVINSRFIHRMFQQMKSDGKIFYGNNSNDETLDTLKNKLLKKDKLVFRFSTSSCGICIDSILLNLSNFSKKYKLQNKILILTPYLYNREIEVFKKVNNIDYEVFNIPDGNLSLLSDQSEEPYLFISDSTLISKSLFIPEKNLPFLTRKYLEHIKNTYFTNANEK
jgi:hypothetical protein